MAARSLSATAGKRVPVAVAAEEAEAAAPRAHPGSDEGTRLPAPSPERHLCPTNGFAAWLPPRERCKAC
eukprot:12010687-Alexandrium_andersonii.AAC.1